jgi:hypothetical protein
VRKEEQPRNRKEKNEETKPKERKKERLKETNNGRRF